MADDALQLTYDPLLLPTAQHRAGLAGLLVIREAMLRRSLGRLPDVSWLEGGRVRIEWTLDSLTAVLNDLYDATWQETQRTKPMAKGKRGSREQIAPKRIIQQTDGKSGKTSKWYIYDQCVPRAGFLSAFGLPDPWAKLWREAVWSTLRGVPNTRLPYKERSEGKSVTEAAKLWRGLQAYRRDLKKGRLHTDEVASCLFIGAQATSADKVPFLGRVDENLLLHFWPVVAGVFVPEVIDRNGDRSFSGFVFAVPDVADLPGFVEDFPLAVSELRIELHGYRPAGAVISVPYEGGLEFLYHLSRLATARSKGGTLGFSVAAVELFHLSKKGKNVHILSSSSVRANRQLLEAYELIRGKYRHPLFRRQVVLNLLRGKSWWDGFTSVFAQFPHEQFIGAGFGRDAQKRLTVDLKRGGDIR